MREGDTRDDEEDVSEKEKRKDSSFLWLYIHVQHVSPNMDMHGTHTDLSFSERT